MVPQSTKHRRLFKYGAITLVVGAVLTLYGAVARNAVFAVGLVLLLAGLVVVILARRGEQAKKVEWDPAVAPLLRQWPLRKARALADIDYGATRTKYTDENDPYVPRAADRSLRYAVGTRRFVLLRGESKAGKSRTLAEAIRNTHPEADLLLPRSAAALAELAALEPPVSDAVIVLDDLTATDLEHLSGAVLDFWASRAFVVGTITTGRYEEAARAGVIARNALTRATVVDLPFELAAPELAAASDDYPDEPGFSSTSGIGAVLVGGEDLVRRLRSGRRDSPAGQAIARAAVDARRAGLRRPITEPELVRLFPKYLERITVGVDPTEDVFTAGLTWATEPIRSQVALMRRVTGGFEVLDYVVAAESETKLPDDTAPDLLAVTAPADAYGLAIAAYIADRPDFAREAYRRAMEHPGTLPVAAYSLASLLVELDDTTAAERVFRQAADTSHPLYANLAMVGLGELLLKQDKAEEAEVLFRQVMTAGEQTATPQALHGLGRALAAKGDQAGAREIYLQAAKSNNPEVAAWAKTALELEA